VSDPARPELRIVPDELDQVARLARFRTAHPAVVIGTGEFGTWQARIPKPDGETIIVRHRLVEVLDKLDELTGNAAG
jgi:hypothetical protein